MLVLNRNEVSNNLESLNKESFNNKIVSYLSCPQGVKDERNQVFESTCNSMRDKISKRKTNR